MPSVNLRLTDEQHAELVEMGKRENRSLQREIIYRLFGRFNQEMKPVVTSTLSVDSQSRDVAARTLGGTSTAGTSAGAVSIQTSTPEPTSSTQQDHFHPDPKPTGRKK